MDTQQQFSPISPNYPSGPRKLSASRSGLIKQNVSSYVYRPQTAPKNANTDIKPSLRSSIEKGSISNMNIIA